MPDIIYFKNFGDKSRDFLNDTFAWWESKKSLLIFVRLYSYIFLKDPKKQFSEDVRYNVTIEVFINWIFGVTYFLYMETTSLCISSGKCLSKVQIDEDANWNWLLISSCSIWIIHIMHCYRMIKKKNSLFRGFLVARRRRIILELCLCSGTIRFVCYAKSIELRVVNYIMLSRAYARPCDVSRRGISGPGGPFLGPPLITHCASRVAY